jgi:hypothetical protein
MLAEALATSAPSGCTALVGALITEIQAHEIGSAGQVDKHLTGSGHARQVIQGAGVQNVEFRWPG